VTAEATSPDLDLSPAAQRLRYFRFAEYVLVFAAISAVSWLVLFFVLLAGHEALSEFGPGFSVLALLLGILLSLAVIYFGVVAYRQAGKLRPALMRRYLRLLPLIGLVLIASAFLFFVQGDGLFSKARKLELTTGLIALQGYDFWSGTIVKTPEIEAQLAERAELVGTIRQDPCRSSCKAISLFSPGYRLSSDFGA
jgi:hypothetical protein